MKSSISSCPRTRHRTLALVVVAHLSFVAHASDPVGVPPSPAAPDATDAAKPPAGPVGDDGGVAGGPALHLVPEAPANGQPFLVELTLPSEMAAPGAEIVVDEAKLGRRRGIVVKRATGALTLLFSVPIEEKKESLPLRLTVRRPGGPVFLVEKSIPIAAHPYEESHLSVAKKFTSPPKAARRRARRESKELDRIMSVSLDESLIRGGFTKPTASEKTSSFGTLRTYNKRRDRSRHLGLDLDGQVGDPIFATERGRVVLAKDRYYSGNTVVVDHGGGLFSMYLHLSAFDVKVGDTVERGQTVGKVGSTGRVTGPHLHFSVKLDGEHLDPESLLALLPADGAVTPTDAGPTTSDRVAPVPVTVPGVR